MSILDRITPTTSRGATQFAVGVTLGVAPLAFTVLLFVIPVRCNPLTNNCDGSVGSAIAFLGFAAGGIGALVAIVLYDLLMRAKRRQAGRG
jgi:hypothetical protein